MNIFVVDEDPAICAEYLDDKRVVKMVLETAQMLSTALGDAGDIFDRYRECLNRKWATDKRPPTWFGMRLDNQVGRKMEDA